MGALYITFWISEAITDRDEVDYDTWLAWSAADYVYGPYDSIVCVYGTIEGLNAETGDRETIAHLVNDDRSDFDGYWRVVKREVYERFASSGARPGFEFLIGQPRSFGHPADEHLPPFSDWSVDVGARAPTRVMREVDAYRPGPDQLEPVEWVWL